MRGFGLLPLSITLIWNNSWEIVICSYYIVFYVKELGVACVLDKARRE